MIKHNISNICPNQINFCGYSQIASILTKYNIDFLNDVIGVEWNFTFKRGFGEGLGKEYDKWVPTYWFTTEKRTVNDILSELYKVQFVSKKFDNIRSMYEGIINKLENDIPVVMMIDPYYLEYFDEYRSTHPETPHYILFYGFDKDEETLVFLDSTRAFIDGVTHLMSLEMLNEMHAKCKNILHIDKCIWYLDTKLLVKDYNRCKEFFLNSIRRMAGNKIYESDGMVEYKGLIAEKKLGEELMLMSEWDDKILYKYKEKFFNSIILASQQRKANYKFAEKYLYRELDERAMGLCKEIYKEWNKLKMCFFNIRKVRESVVFERASHIMKSIYKNETEFIELCLGEKVNNLLNEKE